MELQPMLKYETNSNKIVFFVKKNINNNVHLESDCEFVIYQQIWRLILKKPWTIVLLKL